MQRKQETQTYKFEGVKRTLNIADHVFGGRAKNVLGGGGLDVAAAVGRNIGISIQLYFMRHSRNGMEHLLFRRPPSLSLSMSLLKMVRLSWVRSASSFC